MSQRNSICKSQKPKAVLRRSPRFLQQDQPNTDDAEAPNSEPRRMRVSYSDLTPLSSIRKGSLNKSQKQTKGEISEKAKDTHVRLKSSTKLSTERRISTKLDGVSKDSQCLRRSPRFSEDYKTKGISHEGSKQDDLSKTEKFVDSRRKSDSGIGMRVTRSFIRRNNQERATGSGNGVIGSITGEEVDAQSRSNKDKVKAEVNLSKHCLYTLEKRVTRSSSRGAECEDLQKGGDVKGDKPIQHLSFECLDKAVLSHEENDKMDAKFSKQRMTKTVSRRNCTTSLSEDYPGVGDRKVNEVEKNLAGMKRKRAEAKEGHRNFQGWTREQELALQRAYFAAKPTPHFWKKVSKMVPGKSAQDCFDKIHSDHLTPPQPQPRSRVRGTNTSSHSFSASKLLTSSEPKPKKLRNSKQKSVLSHKAVRELLQKQCKIDQDNEADLFTILEPKLDPSIRIIPDGLLLSTPECNKKGPGFLKRCVERSSSTHRKHRTRLNASCGATLTSPPVLKQVKNKALHEKYIDVLHTREAKRKAASLRATKCVQRKNDAKSNDAQISKIIKAAKDALIFDAREAIDQFHHLQNCLTNDDDVYDDFTDTPEDDIEDRS